LFIAQSIIPICSTAVWNSTFSILAGSTSYSGTSSTLLNSPYNTFFDIYQNMYVVDTSNHRIQRFTHGIDPILILNKLRFRTIFFCSKAQHQVQQLLV